MTTRRPPLAGFALLVLGGVSLWLGSLHTACSGNSCGSDGDSCLNIECCNGLSYVQTFSYDESGHQSTTSCTCHEPATGPNDEPPSQVPAGKEPSGDAPDGPADSYSPSDLIGRWTGSAIGLTKTLPLQLNVDATGRVTGSGVATVWSIDDRGAVTGSLDGEFSFISGSSLVVAKGTWDLQLDARKKSLVGHLEISIAELNNMSVTLTRGAAASSDPLSCSEWGRAGPVDFGTCTEAEIATYDACSQASCESRYEECYGPSYRSGKYSGPCAAYLSCSSQCGCKDMQCQANCRVTSECSSCVSKARAHCELECANELECAAGRRSPMCGEVTCTGFMTALGLIEPGCAKNALGADACGLSTRSLGGTDAGLPAFLEKDAPGVDSPSCAAYFDARESQPNDGDAGVGGNGKIDRTVMVSAIPITTSYPGCCTPTGFCSADTSRGEAIVGMGTMTSRSNSGFGCMDPAVFFRGQPDGQLLVPCDPITGVVRP